MLIEDKTTLDRVRKECRSLVTRRALAAGGASAIPGAVAGVAADVGLLLEMLPKINRAFGLNPEQIDELDEQTRQQVFILAGNLGNAIIGKLVNEQVVLAVLKRVGTRAVTKSVTSWIPVIGSGVAAAIGFGMMKLVGNRHIEECYRIVEQVLEERANRSAVSG